jgi:hypothetical protein
MSILNSTITKPTPTAPKGCIYGGPGVGKTTFASSAENSLIVDCENGAGTIQCQRTPYLETWPAIEQWLTAIEKEKHGHQVIAIDTIDWLVRRLEEHVAGVSGTQFASTLNKSHGGYGNGKQVLKNYIYRCLLPTFDRIVNRGIAVILLAHAKRTDITDIDGVTVEKTTPDLPDDYLNVFVEWADFVCLARKDVDGKRTMLTTEDNRALAKNRYGMPTVIDFTWPAFTGAISAGLSSKFQQKKGN